MSILFFEWVGFTYKKFKIPKSTHAPNLSLYYDHNWKILLVSTMN